MRSKMNSYRIAWLTGDGVGNDVMEAAKIILDTLELDAEYIHGDIGWEFWKTEGNPLPDRTIELLNNVDCALLVRSLPSRNRKLKQNSAPNSRVKGLFIPVRSSVCDRNSTFIQISDPAKHLKEIPSTTEMTLILLFSVKIQKGSTQVWNSIRSRKMFLMHSQRTIKKWQNFQTHLLMILRFRVEFSQEKHAVELYAMHLNMRRSMVIHQLQLLKNRMSSEKHPA